MHQHKPTFLRSKPATGRRCVFFVGNGFSMSFINWAGLERFVDLRCSSLLPPPPNVEYLPSNAPGMNDRFQRSRLWTADKWPKLYQYWNDFGDALPFLNLCSLIAEEGPINPDRDKGEWTFSTDSVQFELRCYLWHLFRYYDLVTGKYVAANDISKWVWARGLRSMLASTTLTAVSLNYDCLLELIISKLGVPLNVPSGQTSAFSWENAKLGQYLIKPHGSISSRGVSAAFALGPNPWLRNMMIQGCKTFLYSDEMDKEYPPVSCPSLPDLVPPGHNEEHLSFPTRFREHDCIQAMSSADSVVFVGVSGSEPDTAEIARYIDHIPITSRIATVGLRRYDDQDNSLARLLKNRRKRTIYQFFDAESDFLPALLRYIKD